MDTKDYQKGKADAYEDAFNKLIQVALSQSGNSNQYEDNLSTINFDED